MCREEVGIEVGRGGWAQVGVALAPVGQVYFGDPGPGRCLFGSVICGPFGRAPAARDGLNEGVDRVGHQGETRFMFMQLRALLCCALLCLVSVGCLSPSHEGGLVENEAISCKPEEEGLDDANGTEAESEEESNTSVKADAAESPGFSPIGDAYCVWGVGRMVIRYMRENGDQWPRSWDDLEPYLVEERMVGWSLATHADRVWIDFDVNVDDLYTLALRPDLESGAVPFTVIRAKSPFAFEFGDGPGGPNGDLLRYLQRDLDGPR